MLDDEDTQLIREERRKQRRLEMKSLELEFQLEERKERRRKESVEKRLSLLELPGNGRANEQSTAEQAALELEAQLNDLKKALNSKSKSHSRVSDVRQNEETEIERERKELEKMMALKKEMERKEKEEKEIEREKKEFERMMTLKKEIEKLEAELSSSVRSQPQPIKPDRKKSKESEIIREVVPLGFTEEQIKSCLQTITEQDLEDPNIVNRLLDILLQNPQDPPSSEKVSQKGEDNLCVICFEREINSVFIR